jgi:hypothetical protein
MTRSTNPAVISTTTGVLKKLLCASAIGLLAGSAQAATINFNNFFGPVAHGDYIQSSGYDLGFYSNVPGAVPGQDLVGTFIDGSTSQSCDIAACPVNNPTTYYGALDDSYIDLTMTSGYRFTVKSFDASFIGGTPILPETAVYPAISGLLRIQGILANGGGSVTETYQLAGPSATGFNFARYNTSAAFSKLEFSEALFYGFACNSAGSCSAFSTDRGQFGIDNINVEVPEPASFALFGLGMAGVAFSRRRKSSKSL